jgi:ribosomal protein S18 acetylase RimI-like enzyme
LIIRPVTPDEYEHLGRLTLAANLALPGHVPDAEYDAELADIAPRAEAAATTVLAAVDDDGTVLGGVTFVADKTSPFAESVPAGAAAIRMLAVDPAAQGRGIGEALVQACLDRARAAGCERVVLHSTPWMTAAHRLYGRLGFVRDPDRDWTPAPGIDLLGFRLEL